MKIVPIDITHKSFKRKMMGYDTEEVTEFLTAIAEEMEAIIHERNRLKEALRDKELQILEYKDRDRILKDTITTAQKMSEKIKLESDREAKIIIQDAHQKADLIVRDSRDSLKDVYREITDLKKMKLQFETSLKALIQSHLDMLSKQDQLAVPTAERRSLADRIKEAQVTDSSVHNLSLK